MYHVPAGTYGLLLDQRRGITSKDWMTRKDLNFTEFVYDPIYYHNTHEFTGPALIETLVQQGYAVYGGDSGGDADASYLLAIPYNEVEVS